MSSGSLASSLLGVAGVGLLGWLFGNAAVSAFLPRLRGGGLERWGWGAAIGFGLLAGHVPLALAAGIRPGWIVFLLLSGGAIALCRRFRLPAAGEAPAFSWSAMSVVLLVATAAGLSIYAVRSLAEPMWSNDFLAIWGLKGKWIFGAASIPAPLFRWPELDFSQPDYPIGLPLLYAGIAFLRGAWDDHAVALVFPFLHLATLLVLVGWLRRRGVSLVASLAAAAFLANLGPLYSAWLTGMAEVPVSLTFLLLGTAMLDCLDRTDPGDVRRLALASVLAASTKNEGLYAVAVVGVLLAASAIRRRDRRLWAGAAAVWIAGLASLLAHRLALGSHPNRTLDLAFLWRTGLPSRVAETLREEWTQLLRPSWPGVLALALLFFLGPRRAAAIPLALLAAAMAGTYLALPVLCRFGPGWLVHWTTGRTLAALSPLLAAGIGLAWSGGAPAVIDREVPAKAPR